MVPRGRYTGQIGFELLRVIFQMLFFGIILGVSIGYVTKFALKLVYNDRFVEASIIIGMSYLVFWLGEVRLLSDASTRQHTPAHASTRQATPAHARPPAHASTRALVDRACVFASFACRSS